MSTKMTILDATVYSVGMLNFHQGFFVDTAFGKVYIDATTNKKRLTADAYITSLESERDRFIGSVCETSDGRHDLEVFLDTFEYVDYWVSIPYSKEDAPVITAYNVLNGFADIIRKGMSHIEDNFEMYNMKFIRFSDEAFPDFIIRAITETSDETCYDDILSLQKTLNGYLAKHLPLYFIKKQERNMMADLLRARYETATRLVRNYFNTMNDNKYLMNEIGKFFEHYDGPDTDLLRMLYGYVRLAVGHTYYASVSCVVCDEDLVNNVNDLFKKIFMHKDEDIDDQKNTAEELLEELTRDPDHQ